MRHKFLGVFNSFFSLNYQEYSHFEFPSTILYLIYLLYSLISDFFQKISLVLRRIWWREMCHFVGKNTSHSSPLKFWVDRRPQDQDLPKTWWSRQNSEIRRALACCCSLESPSLETLGLMLHSLILLKVSPKIFYHFCSLFLFSEKSSQLSDKLLFF